MRSPILLAAVLLATGSAARADAIEIASDAAFELFAIAPPDSEAWIVPGTHRRLETPRGAVHTWSPYGYAPETAILVLYVHGYHIDLDNAWLGQGLPEQFGVSRINALFVACEAPSNPTDHVRWESLSDLLSTVEQATGDSFPKGRVVAIGHSGAYRTIAHWVREPRLETLVLFDAGYGPITPFLQWINGRPDRRLISFASDTIRWTTALHRRLPTTFTIDGVASLGDPRVIDAVQAQRIVHIRSELDHMQLVRGATALPAALQLIRAPRLHIVSSPE